MASTDMQRLVVSLETKIDKFEKALNKANGVANKRAKSIETRFERTNKKLQNFGRNAFRGFAAGAIAALGPMMLLQRAMDTIADTSKIGKVADKVGLAVEELQQLRHVADLVGVKTNELDTGMQRFSRRIAEAATGSGELLKVLEANNVQLRNADGSMRSQRDILRDYADLIKNAGSEQEQLLLAFKAFDTEGAALVNLLRQGADAIDTMAHKADEAGGVIDEEMVRRAEELDDKFTILWRNFDINSTSAILAAVDALDGLNSKLDDLGNADFWGRIGALLGADPNAVFVPGEGVFTEGDENTPSSRIAKAFQGEQEKADAELIEALKKRYGKVTKEASQTVIPPSGGGGGGGGGGGSKKDELQRSINLIKERTAALQAETAAMAGLNPLVEDYDFAITKASATQELLNAAQKAGLAITPELRANIDALATGYANATVEANKLAESQDRARQNAEDMRALGKDVLGGFIKDLQAGKSASDALANALGKVADKLLDVALNSIFDGGGFGGGLGGIFGAIGGLFGFKDGGIAKNGRPMRTFANGGVAKEASIFGETGKPEAAVPLPDGRSIPVTLKTPDIPKGRAVNETVNILLQDDTGRMASIADRRIQTAAGPIIRISVQESQKATKQNMPGLMANAQTRSL